MGNTSHILYAINNVILIYMFSVEQHKHKGYIQHLWNITLLEKPTELQGPWSIKAASYIRIMASFFLNEAEGNIVLFPQRD